MKCCTAQIASCWDNPSGTLRKIRPFIEKAAGSGASLIVFPEQFATGWDPQSARHTQDISGPIVSTLTCYAKEYSIAILGSFRQAGTPLPKNTAVVINTDGIVQAQYSKLHPFTFAGEDKYYNNGDTVSTFELDGIRLGIAICYDLRFPELFRLYAERGVHGVIVPSAWPKSRARHWDLFITARAAENQMYVVGVNTTGRNPVDTYAGGSITADPEGTVIAKSGDDEGLLYSDLDAACVEEARRYFPVLKDKRPDLYGRI